MGKLTVCFAAVLLGSIMAQTDLDQNLWTAAEKFNHKNKQYDWDDINRWFAAATQRGMKPSLNSDLFTGTPLHKAAAANLPVAVKKLIAEGAAKDGFESNGLTPLLIATLLHNTDSAKALLYAGVDPNIPISDASSKTPLHIAILQHNIDLVKALIEAGADPDIPSKPYRTTPLMSASYSGSNLTLVKVLLDANANVHLSNDHGETALHYTVDGSGVANKTNQHAIAQNLLRKGAYANEKDHDGKTPADVAREYENYELANLIENYRGPYETTITAKYDLYLHLLAGGGYLMYVVATIL